MCFALWLLIADLLQRRPRTRLTLGHRQTEMSEMSESTTSLPSLGAEAADLHPNTTRRNRFTMGFVQDWKAIWTETGTVGLVVCILEGILQMLLHSFSRAVHLHLVLGVSKGFALLLISMILLFQLAACATLLVPTLYFTTGTIAPSAVLVATVWFEALVFGDATDRMMMVRTLCLTATAVMLALFRFDRQARNSAQQLPTSDALLGLEATVRRACTAARTGLMLPPTAGALVLWSFYANAFWRTHGILFEWYRGRFQVGLALASLFFLLAGQDTKAQGWVSCVIERIGARWEHVTLPGLSPVSGRRPPGRKKAL